MSTSCVRTSAVSTCGLAGVGFREPDERAEWAEWAEWAEAEERLSRLVRERGHVGRRIWRRRKRRAPSGEGAAETAGGAAAPSGELEEEIDEEVEDTEDLDQPGQVHDPDLFDDVEPAPFLPAPARGTKKAEKKGFFASLKGAFTREKPPPPEPAYLVVDPTRTVLAVPRGAARLDAFERAVQDTPPASPHFRPLALAFLKELQALAEGAGVDLSLLENRVEACAKALIAAGEEERAGTLFLRVGRRHQAAELFVAAGAIDALEEAHAQIHHDEGGTRHEARLSFERFEALFLVGMREPALLCLEKAHRLWGDNVVYAEIFRTFTERLGKPQRLSLASGKNELVLVSSWPVVIGRGEDAGVRLTSPLISRAHLAVELEGGAPVVVDLESRGGTRIAGAPLVGKTALPARADIDMAGVVVTTHLGGNALWLSPALAPHQRTLAATGGSVTLNGPEVLGPEPRAPHAADATTPDIVKVRFDARGRAVLEQPALLNGEALRRATLLLEGDKLGPLSGAWSWTVARR